MNITVGKLLDFLDSHKGYYVPLGNPHSWRGSYEEMALEPYYSEMWVAADLAHLIRATPVLHGWKGGYHDVTPNTPIWVAEEGVGGCLALVGFRIVGNSLVPVVEDDEDFVFPITTLGELSVGESCSIVGAEGSFTVTYIGNNLCVVRNQHGIEISYHRNIEVTRDKK